MKFSEWQKKSISANEMADRIKWMRLNRAIKLCAGIGFDYRLCHNALVALHYGKPWSVNYKVVKKAKHLMDTMFIGQHIADHYSKRLWEKIDH